MVKLSDLSSVESEYLASLPCPEFGSTPWAGKTRLDNARVALISTAGIHAKGDKPFVEGSSGYRIIPSDTASGQITMSHISVNFDRTGFQEDINTIFPVDRLGELESQGAIGSVSEFHYSFMGATDPRAMEGTTRQMAHLLKADNVDVVLLCPV